MLTDLLYRLRAVFLRKTVERELEDELRFHFEQETNKYVESGLSRDAQADIQRAEASLFFP